MEGKKMLKSIKRLACALLIAVFIVGSVSATSAEAALSRPGSLRFVQWNNTAFSSATIAWKSVPGAAAYQVRCVWTDGSHNVGGYVGAGYNGVRINNMNYKHVYVTNVRAVQANSRGQITGYSPWSNTVIITPWPKNVSAKLTSSKGTNVKFNWNIIYGSSGYNIFMSTNPYGKWYWNLSTATKATATSGTVKSFRGSKLKKYQNYYVRVITRRKRFGVFCTVPEPYKSYYQYKFYIYTTYR